MKKRLILVLTALMILTLVFPGSVPAAARADGVPTEAQVYEILMSMQSEYPEGTPWTNENFYAWNGGGHYYGGYGCVAFAYILSDAAFGSLPSRYISEIKIENIHVGDILRINNDTHTVIVLKVNGTESVTIAEGNYNRSVHWGRTLTRAQIEGPSTTELQTRYPLGTFENLPLESITLNYTAKTLTRKAGSLSPTVKLKPSFTPANAADVRVTWKSSNPKVAKVNSKGLVTAVAPGKATITCTSVANPSVKAKCVVTVKNTLVKKITLNYKEKTLKIGKTLQLKATVKPATAVNRKVKWVSSDEEVATVSSKGKVRAVGSGTCVIRCLSTDGSDVVAKCTIRVK